MAAPTELRWPQIAGVALLGCALAGLSFTLALGQVLRTSAPEAALGLVPVDGLAQERAANRLIDDDTILTGAPLDDGLAARLSQLSSEALTREPTASRALRNLALTAGDAEQAEQLMTRALRLSPRDPAAHLWMIRHRAVQGDSVGALAHFDTLLRLEPALRDALMPQFVRLLGDPAAIVPLAQRLSLRPEWEEEFWQAASRYEPGLGNLAKLRAQLGPANDATQRRNDEFILQALVNAAQFSEAEQLAARVLPGFVAGPGLRNGDFSAPPALRPFDWRLFAQGGFSSWLDSEGERLVLAAEPGAQGLAATQVLGLEPGDWQLSARTAREPAPGLDATIELRCAERPSAPVATLHVPSTNAVPVRIGEACRWFSLSVRILPAHGPDIGELAIEHVTLTRIGPR